MINLSRAIGYPFQGQAAISKTIVGALLVMFLPLFFLSGFVLLGYQVRIIRDVLDERDDELPEWDRLPEDFLRGIVVLAGCLVYYIPSLILVGLGVVSLRNAVSLPGNFYGPAPWSGPEFDRAGLSMVCLTFALALIWLVISAPLVMAAVARYAETGKASVFLRVLELADEAWDQRGAAAQLALNLFLLALLAQIAGMLASVTCLAGVYVQFIQFAAISHLNGQWGRVLKERRPRPSVIRPIQPQR